MPLSWNEIRRRAVQFAHEFKDARRENAETHTFYNEFFNVFGISRRRVASFEEPVKMLGAKRGRIDLFWKGTLIVEQKSAGRDLARAKTQALEYFPNLSEDELPQYILVSDFQTFELHDLDGDSSVAFKLSELPNNIEQFAFIAGYKRREFKDQDPVNIKASVIMGGIHDALKANGYVGADLELFLVRLLFCLFADDTGIFEKGIFTSFVEDRTRPDGSDLGGQLALLFQTLNQETASRPKNLDEDVATFPYVNGDLFRRHLPLASFDSVMRDALLKACYFDWSEISPAVFGALFQHVMDTEDKDKRRGIGAHYTTERAIMKVIRPLFLDALRDELELAKTSKPKLRVLHDKLAGLRFLDPACGCGNFLIIAYRELRLLELDLLKFLHPNRDQLQFGDITRLSRVNVDQFYGIEIEEFPARIAEVALWLVDHQMNNRLSTEFGHLYVRIPLTTSPHIINANALRADWNGLVRASELSFILGNPPFIGHQYRSDAQVEDHTLVWGTKGRFGRLDYVTCWYRKALDYMRDNTAIQAAFVSTNSITQGEQASILWSFMFQSAAHISFAHRTFQWASDARGKAAVHCVIVGFSLREPSNRRLFEYDDIKGDPHEIGKVNNINGYLIDGPNIALPSRTKPRPHLPAMTKGSQITDGGHLIFTDDEKASFVISEPASEPWFKKYVGGEELIASTHRWCLWLKDITPQQLNAMPLVKERLAAVRRSRLESPTASVQEYANKPTLFTQDRQPSAPYLGIPKVSSINRRYIPMAFLMPDIVATDMVHILVGAANYHFGILSSQMHVAWVGTVCGRLKSDFRYSPAIYDNFPFPNPTDAQRKLIEDAAQGVLDVRAKFAAASLADLYDPIAMPPELTKAHASLDRAVDRSYRPQPFLNERLRMEFLFKLYEVEVAPLVTLPRKAKRK